MFERMKKLSYQELGILHTTSMSIIGKIVVAFHDPEAIEIFRQHGFKLDNKIVFFDENKVQRALEKVPDQFIISARNPDNSVCIGGDNLVISPGFGASWIMDSQAELRPPLLQDYNDFCKLIQTSDHIDMNGILMVDPSDLSPEQAHLEMIRSNLLLCDKPFLGSSASRQAAIDSLEMAGIVWGSMEALKDYQVLMPIISALSPLQYSGEHTASLIEYARYGQPILIGQLMMAGTTGPVSLPGLLALQNAEILAAIVLTQLINPGVPIIYGTTSSVTDLRRGTLSVGAPEFSMIQSATIQMAQYYNVPSRGSGGITDAHFPDMQAGIESTLAQTVAVLSGAHFMFHACGILSSYMAMSFEKFVIDEELCAMLRRLLKPITITEENCDLEVIQEVGIGGQYLTHPSTFTNCRTFYHHSDLMQRDQYHRWKSKGKTTLYQNADELINKRLVRYHQPDIDPGIKRDLAVFIDQRRS